jgi:hypothetical protein
MEQKRSDFTRKVLLRGAPIVGAHFISLWRAVDTGFQRPSTLPSSVSLSLVSLLTLLLIQSNI